MSGHTPPKKKLLKYSAYLLTFVVGMWGGRLLIDQISGNAQGREAAQAMVKRPAPEFSLPDIHGKLRNSHEWDGKVVVLNFWATWCPPCQKETPMFVELQEKYSATGLQFVGVAIDTAEKVQDFMDTYGINYPMLIGEEPAIEIAKAYGDRFGALPYTVVIDRQGQIQFVQRGEMKRDPLEQVLAQLL
ncbi:MAG TPA: TlpA family protein disulfide reductase [Gammaproteobacteria bacterium]|nr:TlpA family protein disulfide reductase [Gammaproteobacteria bacterium]